MSEDEIDPKNRGLGRGLAALFGEDEDLEALALSDEELDEVVEGGSETNLSEEAEGLQFRVMPIEWLSPCPFQPRRHFEKDALKELSESIAVHGIIQPLLVRPSPEGADGYEIIAGERRWRAAQLAQLHEVPVTIQYLTDADVLELALIENLQREDLSPIEEAEAYQRLINEHGHTQEKLAATLGKSRSHIANTLRLQTLPDSVKGLVNDGRLSAGHARTLVGADNAEEIAKEIVSQGLSVRDAERLRAEGTEKASGTSKKSSGQVSSNNGASADVSALEQDLSNLLGLNVRIDTKGKGGVLSMEYQTLDQLDDILHKLSHNPGRIVVQG